MTPERPFLCRLGMHRWEVKHENNLFKAMRCTRGGCHRAMLDFGPGDRQQYDQFLCSCGVEIVPARADFAFWRNVNNGEVCSDNHWHEPAR